MRKKTFRVLAGCIFLVSMLAGGAFAQSVTFESNLGGSARYSLLSGTTLYSLMGSRLYIADASTMSTPVVLSSIALPGIGRRIVKDGNILYISCTRGGLAVVNVADPANPAILKVLTFDRPDEICQTFDAALNGNYLYVADYSGVFVLDVTDPANPVTVRQFTAFDADHPNTYDAYIDGTNLFICCEFDGLYIFDIGANDKLNKISNIPGQYYCSLRDGDYLYIAAGGKGFEILDISDLANPTSVSILENDYQGILGFVKANGYVYLCSEFEDFYKIDVSDPTDPQEVQQFYLDGNHSLGISVSGDYVLLANSTYGIRIFDTRAAAIQQVGELRTLGRVLDCRGAGDYAYAAVGAYGLAVLDVTHPAQPLQISQTSLSGYTNGLAVAGSFAYVAQTNHEGEDGGLLEIVDITNPLAPVILGSVDLPGQPFTVQVQGNLAVVACQTEGVAVVDVSDPSEPELLGMFDTAGVCYAPLMWGDYILAADGIKGLAALDMKDPAHIKKVAGGYDLGNVTDIAIWDTWLYLPAGDTLHIASFDPLYLPAVDDATISSDTERHETGQLKAVAAFDGYLLVADSVGGARLFDIAEPAAPVERTGADYLVGEPAKAAYAADQGLAYIASQIAGLYIYSVDLPAKPAFNANGIWSGSGMEGENAIGITADFYQAQDDVTGTLTIYGDTVLVGQVTAEIGGDGHLTGTIAYSDSTAGTLDLTKSGSGLSGSISGAAEISGVALAYTSARGLMAFDSIAPFMNEAISAGLETARGLKKRSLTQAQKMMTMAMAQSDLSRQLGLSAFAAAMIGPRAAAGMIPAAEALLYQSALWETLVAQAEAGIMAETICDDYQRRINLLVNLGDRMLEQGKRAGDRDRTVQGLLSFGKAASYYSRAAEYYQQNMGNCPTWGEAEFNGFYDGPLDFGIVSASLQICAVQAEDGTLTGDARIMVAASGEDMKGRFATPDDLADTDPETGVCPSDEPGICSLPQSNTVDGVTTVTGTILVTIGDITAHLEMRLQYNLRTSQWEGQIEVKEQTIIGNLTAKKVADTCPDGFPKN